MVSVPSSRKRMLEGQLSCPTSPAVKKFYRLIIAGSANTGKSAIVNRFLNNNFEERYIPTIENFHRKHYKIRGEIHQLDILDLSGNNPFPETRAVSYLGGEHSQTLLFELLN
uniref:G domain-containing protein n=1 Tax=Syphacia muris TaxID=451379 RepID=A0A0N5AZA1_9BILA